MALAMVRKMMRQEQIKLNLKSSDHYGGHQSKEDRNQNAV
jgi:hypothetical protein